MYGFVLHDVLSENDLIMMVELSEKSLYGFVLLDVLSENDQIMMVELSVCHGLKQALSCCRNHNVVGISVVLEVVMEGFQDGLL